MLREIIFKETQQTLFDPKFIVISSVSFVLIAISLFNGYIAYGVEMEEASRLNRIEIEKLSSGEDLEWIQGRSFYRQPPILSIFDAGLHGYIGRYFSADKASSGYSFSGSRNSDNPIMALFGNLDVSFVVITILSLFAILMSYGAIAGERERGTLQLLISYGIRRPVVILGKLIGLFIPLSLVLIIPLLLGLLSLSILTDVSFSGGEWLRISLILLTYLLYLLTFLCIGLAMSALNRTSFVSFIMCLVIWTIGVAVIPRIAIHVADRLTSRPDIEQIIKEQRKKIEEAGLDQILMMKQYLDSHNLTREEFTRQIGAIFMELQDERLDKERVIREQHDNEHDRLQREQIRTVLAFARFSPASCADATVSRLSHTGPMMLFTYKENMKRYASDFIKWISPMREKARKQRNESMSQRMYDFNESGTLVVNEEVIAAHEKPSIDLSGMPVLEFPPPAFSEYAGVIFTSFSVLAGYTTFFFIIAYVAFLRYDVR